MVAWCVKLRQRDLIPDCITQRRCGWLLGVYWHHSSHSTVSRIADGVSGAAQTFLANFDPFKDQQREAEFNLVQAQLANLNADTALKSGRV